ncbi:asparagine synthase family amidotransferase [Ferrimonas balearica DSM 9799]|uniref:asparagine synthase (glutamine-hydrolyzing) n=1 Tax=Ferrimonas balearica (strain DSM 9799 / CCM 4581 / KCTC 23876 / PAT) TaxID=550540 RepID=E1SL50_FERBD|nr:N-acetylglutaminylglutamine amidotransferase [Ferrimonas balearica]ADN75428.1 asparagine synthase family amidotransferase [Ferrimonas balearica DSM 9799]
MCGFAGFHSDNPAPEHKQWVERMVETLAPRGPDSEGLMVRQGLVLGHRRLKVIDLSDQGSQPMTDLGLDLVFNGCLYNYPELRKTLAGLGYQFFSNSDTEVLLKAYHAWGPNCVERFNGMFAFAIHEQKTGRLVLGRDRLGIKPLYLAQHRDGLAFASTLPALLEVPGLDTELDPIALNHYLSFHAVVPAPHTLLKGIKKLPPATVRTIHPDGRQEDHNYWQFQVGEREQDHHITDEEWEQQLLDTLRTSVRRRMVADVPVGVLLSGGLDSSLIVGLLAEQGQHNLNTFSVGFEAAGGESGDEFRYSDLIARHYGTEHHKIEVPSSTLLDTLPKTFQAMSEPMVSYDNVGFFLLSQQVSKHLKVVQSGQGADEIFAGYHWYPPLQGSADPVETYASHFMDRDYAEYCRTVTSGYHTGDHATAFIRSRFARPDGHGPVDKALHLDTSVMLTDDPVKRVDNMTMAWGLEARVPFLDHEVVELAGRIPARLKLGDNGKGILKSLGRKVIPSAVIDRPKGYFPVPALKYIEGPYLEFVQNALNSERARQRGLFQRDYLTALLDDPKSHITPLRGSKLWQVALLEMWLQTHNL